MCSAVDSDTWVMKQRAWLLYLVTAEAALFAYLFVPGFRQGFVFNLIALSSPIAIVQAVRMWKPTVKAPWYLFALGQTFFVAGDVITYNYEKFFGTALPFPSIGDVLYLSVYPCLIAGILLLVRRRSPGRDREGLIDSLIVAVGLGVISWSFLMGPIAHDSSSTPLQKLVSMGYPFMDLVLLTVVVRLAIAPGRRGLAFYLLPAAALFLFATDFLYSYISVQGLVYDQSGYLEAGWATFYILWGAAALHPSMAALSDRAPDKEIRLTRARGSCCSARPRSPRNSFGSCSSCAASTATSGSSPAPRRSSSSSSRSACRASCTSSSSRSAERRRSAPRAHRS